MFAAIVTLTSGLVLLITGAELLVYGASAISRRLGIPPLVVGLTVVAFGTSAPECVVSAVSAFRGNPDIAVGNVVGSNIFNILFILGVTAVISPLAVSLDVIRRDVPFMTAASLALLIMSLDGILGRVDGALLICGIIVYTGGMLRGMKAVQETMPDATVPPGRGRFIEKPLCSIAAISAGLALLGIGSHLLIDGAVHMARLFGIGELVIGLTIVSAGTSLPEAATSIAAALRGNRDIAVGNVVGSNIFNILFVLGIASLAAPGGVTVSESAGTFDIPFMTAAAIACLPVFFTGAVIDRLEGKFFFVYYGVYLTYLIVWSSPHCPAEPFVPISSRAAGTAIVTSFMLLAGLGTIRSWRNSRRAGCAGSAGDDRRGVPEDLNDI